MSYERRIHIWLAVLALPSILLAVSLAYLETRSAMSAMMVGLVLAAVWLIAGSYFFEQLTRPLQTLSNVVAALREDDYSFRARGARRGDTLGDLALEVNALAGMLQGQRSAARDALTLVERVMTSMQSPVLAFDPEGHLRLINPAAEHIFDLKRSTAIGRSALELDLSQLFQMEDQGLYAAAPGRNSVEGHTSPHVTRWSVRRTTFRLQGVPHVLLVLADVAAALQEEERVAWQRLIRVLSHEINNSLTPIKSLAGSLRSRLPALLPAEAPSDTLHEFGWALNVIEERAASLNRFLQAYQHMTRLPPPQLRSISVPWLVEQVTGLERRLPVLIESHLPLSVHGDADQLQQLLINLVRNAVEAALSPDASAQAEPGVWIRWFLRDGQAILQVRDNGPGLTNPANLFVPFYTTKPEGSGIGLVLAQQIAAVHKGLVTLVNNDAAPGCTAELRLPAEPHMGAEESE